MVTSLILEDVMKTTEKTLKKLTDINKKSKKKNYDLSFSDFFMFALKLSRCRFPLM